MKRTERMYLIYQYIDLSIKTHNNWFQAIGINLQNIAIENVKNMIATMKIEHMEIYGYEWEGLSYESFFNHI